ncbi:GNAT family N-acetyltransferase [Ferrimonas sediminicola]|uniref:GNAT family N-acetyltransferase n=1 Tax=Ferrimonas sediminicola TaxID=2569538 RepID=A0A4U1BEU7_9GAMM|nr:GNAT family N-acetyltransferase [Ferrimonas sediminicola]TKB48870.1 GNAT family N-acetyltransferase [Ferrimonas sediminicola]
MIIRAARPEDAVDICQTMAQPECYGNTLQLPYPTEQMWHQRLSGKPENLHLLVVELQGRVVANGGLELSTAPRRRHVANLGMAVHPEFQGQGVGTALLSALLELADNWLALRRVELEVYTGNQPALALYRKQGFEVEGTAREYAFRDGHYVDALLMARLRPQAG